MSRSNFPESQGNKPNSKRNDHHTRNGYQHPGYNRARHRGNTKFADDRAGNDSNITERGAEYADGCSEFHFNASRFHVDSSAQWRQHGHRGRQFDVNSATAVMQCQLEAREMEPNGLLFLLPNPRQPRYAANWDGGMQARLPGLSRQSNPARLPRLPKS